MNECVYLRICADYLQMFLVAASAATVEQRAVLCGLQEGCGRDDRRLAPIQLFSRVRRGMPLAGVTRARSDAKRVRSTGCLIENTLNSAPAPTPNGY